MEIRRISAFLLTAVMLSSFTSCSLRRTSSDTDAGDDYPYEMESSNRSEAPIQTATSEATTDEMTSTAEETTTSRETTTAETTTEPAEVGSKHISQKKTYESKKSTDRVIISVDDPSEYLVRIEKFDKQGMLLRIEDSELMYGGDVDYFHSYSQNWCSDDKTTYYHTFNLEENSNIDIPANSWALYAKYFNYNDAGECTGEIGYNSYGDVLFTRSYDLENHTAVMSHRASAVKSTDGKMYYYHYNEVYDDKWNILSAELFDPFKTKLLDVYDFNGGKTLRLPNGESFSLSGKKLEYDENGNVIKCYDNYLNVDYFGFEYDDHNNMIREYYHFKEPIDGVTTCTVDQCSYSYDNMGHLYQVRYNEYDEKKEHIKRKYITTYAYNESGQVINKHEVIENYFISVEENDYGKYKDGSCGSKYITEYEYNGNGDLKKETYSSQKLHGDITYNPEDLGYTRYEYTYY